MRTPYKDKFGVELYVGDFVKLLNWNHNEPEPYKDEIRVIQMDKKEFIVVDAQFETGCWCSMEMINFGLCEKINKNHI